MRRLLQLECMFLASASPQSTCALFPNQSKPTPLGSFPKLLLSLHVLCILARWIKVLQGYIDSPSTKNHVFGEIREVFMQPSKK